jgi:DNA-binding HxlR family transcriptional regulator
VRRTVYPVVPPRVDYDLTKLGATLLDALAPLVTWARDHSDEVARARAAYAGERADEGEITPPVAPVGR